MKELIQGLSFGFFVLGTLILALQIMRVLYNRSEVFHREYIVGKNRLDKKTGFSIYHWGWLAKFKEMVEIAGVGFSPNVILSAAIILFFLAFFSTDIIVNVLRLQYAVGAARAIDPANKLLNVLFALLISSLPLFYVFFKLQRKRQEIALSMIATVQNFIGNYNNNLTLGDLVTKSAKTMPREIQSEWMFLEMAVRTRDMREAVLDFARRIDNHWGDDFADILLVKGEYGNDVTNSLHKLVREMQAAKANEQKRQAMISIYRIGTSMMVGFALLIIGINISLDGNNYKYYFIDPRGKLLIEISILVLFASLVLVVFSGRKRI